ncbi:hypothetical protein V8F20_003424 [Naviculisporaceae sp. PSN 640]
MLGIVPQLPLSVSVMVQRTWSLLPAAPRGAATIRRLESDRFGRRCYARIPPHGYRTRLSVARPASPRPTAASPTLDDAVNGSPHIVNQAEPPSGHLPAAEGTKDVTKKDDSTLDWLSNKDAIGKHLFDTPNDVETEIPNQERFRLRRTGSSTLKIRRWTPPPPDASAATQGRPALPNSYLKLTNLPDNTTTRILLTALGMHGPFGKVVHCSVRSYPGDTSAMILLDSRSGAESLFSFIDQRKFAIGGRAVQCNWWSRSLRPTIIQAGAGYNLSRVLVVATRRHKEDYNFLGILSTIDTPAGEPVDVVVEPVLAVGSWNAVLCSFNGISVASRAKTRLDRGGIRSWCWGVDPVAVGPTAAYEANLRLAEQLITEELRAERNAERNARKEAPEHRKSLAEQTRERIEQQLKQSQNKEQLERQPEGRISPDPFEFLVEGAHRPAAKKTSANESSHSPPGTDAWEDAVPGVDGANLANTAADTSIPDDLATMEEPGAARGPELGKEQGPKSGDQATSFLEDIEKRLERVRKEY